ncbi:hypothetical protein BDV96DRAFT_603834 [Lophiotrema nucula]|uniref:F-box domain-containing protein n=1 Tax=Lophiotrema nucula TaxID=690887 RepID=A0A6A5YVH3_9PLEO|nr:hypothetical protein BDV96DRAFT_603834 [Lophiotrema nucula]
MVPFPTELHAQIVRHLPPLDLYNYRLASKLFADIGATELFETVTFHAGIQSVERLASLAKHEKLRQVVRAIRWDTNQWDLLMNLVTFRSLMQRRSNGAYTEAAVLEAYRRYNKLVDDETALLDESAGQLGPTRIYEILKRFPRLNKVFIINGDYHYSRRSVIKDSILVRRNPSGSVQRGEGLYDQSISNGDAAGPGLHAWWSLVADGQTVDRTGFTKLRADVLDWKAFTRKTVGFQNPLPNLTSIKLRITSHWDGGRQRDRDLEDHLRTFLSGLKQLKSLQLEYPTILIKWPEVSLASVLPLESCWPRLRKLSLQNMYVHEPDLLRVLSNYAATLKDLRLADLWLLSDSDWRTTFKKIRAIVDLDRALMTGMFCNVMPDEDAHPEDRERGQMHWDMSVEGIRVALEHFLVGGGEFPLTADNASWFEPEEDDLTDSSDASETED